MEKKEEKKKFVEPELIKHEEKLDEVTTMMHGGSHHGHGFGHGHGHGHGRH